MLGNSPNPIFERVTVPFFLPLPALHRTLGPLFRQQSLLVLLIPGNVLVEGKTRAAAVEYYSIVYDMHVDRRREACLSPPEERKEKESGNFAVHLITKLHKTLKIGYTGSKFPIFCADGISNIRDWRISALCLLFLAIAFLCLFPRCFLPSHLRRRGRRGRAERKYETALGITQYTEKAEPGSRWGLVHKKHFNFSQVPFFAKRRTINLKHFCSCVDVTRKSNFPLPSHRK